MNVGIAAGRIAVLVLVAGCAARGGGPYGHLELPVEAVDGLAGRACRYAAEPRVPGTLATLVRPGTRGSLLLWGRGLEAGDSLHVSVRYGLDGTVEWVRRIGGTLDDERWSELERILGGGLLDRGPADWGFRVRFAGTGEAAVLPSVICDPERRLTPGQAVPPAGSAAEVAAAWQARRRLEVVVSLDGEGRVLDAGLVTASGNHRLDQYALDLASSYRYEPKLHDGVGIPSRLRYRLTIPR